MNTNGLYVHGKSYIHKVDPVTKIVYILFINLLPVILPNIRVAAACAALSVLLLLWARVIKQALPVYGFVAIVLITMVIVQGLFGAYNQTPLFRLIGLTFYKEGLMHSAVTVCRVLNLVGSFLILSLTTKPSDLVESLVRAGLSPRFGYVVGSVFQIIPQMTATMGVISDAQRARGMETEGSLMVRIKAFIPLLGPLVLNAFINTKERAMALEVRGFNANHPKTFLNEAYAFGHKKILRALMALSACAAVVGRLMGL